MAPIAKEPDVQNSSVPASPASGSQPKAQPVALEISVTVNGARTVEGSDKREPFSETTQTVLVFGNGAVIRLNSAVAPGQLLFLTNEKTKKEVVCQVVKSKNYRSVSGYVELEFTEPAVGFWGMRFPTDRVMPAASQPSGVPAPVAPAKPAPVAVSGEANTVLSAQQAKPVISPAPIAVAPPVSVGPPPAPPIVAKTEVPAPPVNNSTEELKRETARLQEQFSTMLFSEAPKAKQPAPVAPLDANAFSDTTAKILELTKPQPVVSQSKSEPAPAAKPFEPLNLAPITPKSRPTTSVHDEEVKIPSWLEPLARNTGTTTAAPPPAPSVAPSTPMEIPVSEEAQVAGESYDFGSHSHTEAVSIASSVSSESEAPSFGANFLETSDNIPVETGTGGGNKAAWIGAAAATILLAAGGGWWYMQQSGQKSVSAASTTSRTVSQPVSQPTGDQQLQNLVPTSTPNNGKPYSNPSPVNAQPSNTGKAIVSPAVDVQKIPAAHDPLKNVPSSDTSHAAEPVEQTRKSTFGQIRLAAPTVKSGSNANASNVSEPGIVLESGSAPSAGAVSGGFVASHANQPSVPVPIGGEVKPAQLLSSAAPLYPQLARNQRISGDVKIDALIDERGRVTGMKVISGPAILHQSAMDSLRQWKYRPASLNGEPVSMHLLVTIQFRLQ